MKILQKECRETGENVSIRGKACSSLLAGLGVLLGEAGLLIDPAPRLDAGPVLVGEAFRFVVDDMSIHKLM